VKSAKVIKPRWNRRKSDRPREIVAAALDVFVARGFRGARIEEVARRAGVSKGTLYLYYRNKATLFRAVVREMVVPEIVRVERRVREYQGSRADLIRDLVEQWWDTVGTGPLCGIPKLMVAESGNFPELARFYTEEAVRRVRRLFATVLKQGITRGEFRSCHVPYTVRLLTAPLVFAAIYERSLRPYDAEPYDPRRFLREHVELFLRGIEFRSQPMRRAG